MRTCSAVDWRNVKTNLGNALSDEDTQILNYLIAGQSTPRIAKLMNQHRSMVWRKVQSIKQRGSA